MYDDIARETCCALCCRRKNARLSLSLYLCAIELLKLILLLFSSSNFSCVFWHPKCRQLNNDGTVGSFSCHFMMARDPKHKLGMCETSCCEICLGNFSFLFLISIIYHLVNSSAHTHSGDTTSASWFGSLVVGTAFQNSVVRVWWMAHGLCSASLKTFYYYFRMGCVWLLIALLWKNLGHSIPKPSPDSC